MANEMRLIDADALTDKVDESKYNNPHPQGMVRVNHRNEHDHFLRMIMDAPTVDAVEVVHGRWLDNGMCNHKPSRFRNPDKWTVYKCSECGYSNGRRKNANYCPNCGAKMDGDGNDQ